MFTVYLLYSDCFQKSYVGFTTDLAARFRSHNELATKGWTVKYRPWRIVHTEVYATKREAMQRERWFKSGVGREYIRRLLLRS